MHQTDEDVAGLVVLLLQVALHLVEKRPVPGAVALDEDPGRLVRAENVVVLEEDLEIEAVTGGSGH